MKPLKLKTVAKKLKVGKSLLTGLLFGGENGKSKDVIQEVTDKHLDQLIEALNAIQITKKQENIFKALDCNQFILSSNSFSEGNFYGNNSNLISSKDYLSIEETFLQHEYEELQYSSYQSLNFVQYQAQFRRRVSKECVRFFFTKNSLKRIIRSSRIKKFIINQREHILSIITGQLYYAFPDDEDENRGFAWNAKLLYCSK